MGGSDSVMGCNPSFDEDFNSSLHVVGSPSLLMGTSGQLSVERGVGGNRMTPPSSPHVGVSSPSTHKMDSSLVSNSSEAMELQLDFWTNQQDSTLSSATAGWATNAILFCWL